METEVIVHTGIFLLLIVIICIFGVRSSKKYSKEEVMVLIQNAQLTTDQEMAEEFNWDWNKFIEYTLNKYKE